MTKAYGQRTCDSSVLTERAMRRFLEEQGFAIEETGGGCFNAQCPDCKSTGLDLECQYCGNPHLYPRIRCRRCDATPQSVAMTLRVASVVARAKTPYRTPRRNSPPFTPRRKPSR